MGMHIILNANVWLPHGDERVTVQVKGDNIWVPDELDDVCNLSIRLGTFYGYELGEYIRVNSSNDYSTSDTWQLTSDEADLFILEADTDLKDYNLPFSEDLQDFVDTLRNALSKGYEEFEISLWY